ncbi:MAG: hypothetical protein RLZZ416_563, partial [Candidatus Parcubacteria bacterium]
LAAKNPEAPAYPFVAGDSVTYAALADSLIEHGGFTGSGFEQERHWPPAYPVFLAVTKWLGGGFYLAIVLQVLASLGAVALVYKMALKFVSPGWASIPALLFGLDPSVVLANTTVLSDGLFASLIVSGVYLAFFARMPSETAKWAIIALVISVAALMRPIGQFLILLVPLALASILYFRSRNARKLMVPLAAYVVVSVLMLAPWLSFVHSRFGVYEISHVAASNLLYYNARDFLAWKEMNKRHYVPIYLASRYRDDPAYKTVDEEIARSLSALTPPGKDTANYEGKLAARLILQDPIGYAYYHIVNTAPFFIGSSIGAYHQVVQELTTGEGYSPTSLVLVQSARAALAARAPSEFLSALAPVAPILLETLAWALAAFFAVVEFFLKRREPLIWLFALLILYFAALTGPVSIPRYRIPAEPFILILATIGASAIVESYKRVIWNRKSTS